MLPNPNNVTIRKQMSGKNNTYDAVYFSLAIIENMRYPIPKSYISNSVIIQNLIIESDLVKESTDNPNPNQRKSKSVHKYYTISQKGKEFMKAYEYMRGFLEQEEEEDK